MVQAATAVATTATTSLASNIIDDGLEIVEQKDNKVGVLLRKTVILSLILLCLFLVRVYYYRGT